MNRQPKGHLILPAEMTTMPGDSEEHSGQEKMRVGQLMSPQPCESAPYRAPAASLPAWEKDVQKMPFLSLDFDWDGGLVQEKGHMFVISFQMAVSGLEKPWEEEYKTFYFFFGCLILVKFTCWPVLLTSLYLRSFFWHPVKTGRIFNPSEATLQEQKDLRKIYNK